MLKYLLFIPLDAKKKTKQFYHIREIGKIVWISVSDISSYSCISYHFFKKSIFSCLLKRLTVPYCKFMVELIFLRSITKQEFVTWHQSCVQTSDTLFLLFSIWIVTPKIQWYHLVCVLRVDKRDKAKQKGQRSHAIDWLRSNPQTLILTVWFECYHSWHRKCWFLNRLKKKLDFSNRK